MSHNREPNADFQLGLKNFLRLTNSVGNINITKSQKVTKDFYKTEKL